MHILNKNIQNYNILEKLIAGIVLEGWEVKYLKIFKNINFKNSYIINYNKEIFLKNSVINKKGEILKKTNRLRKLLLKKNEIDFLIKKIKNNFKIIPICFFLKKIFIKLEIGVGLKKFKKIKYYKNEKK